MHRQFHLPLFVAALIVAASSLIGSPRAARALDSSGPKKRVGVVAFQDKTGHRGVAEAGIDVLTTELAKTGKYIVVERAEMDQVLKEQAFGQGGAVNPDTAAKAGKILGLQGILVGVVSNFGHKKVDTQLTPFLPLAGKGSLASVVTIDVRIIDSETGQILAAESGTGAVEITATNVLGFGPTYVYDSTIDGGAFRAAVVQMMSNLIGHLEQGEWRGRVVAVSPDGMATINAGQATGLSLGSELACFALGEEIIDPDTGVSLGREEGAIKGICQITSFYGKGNDLSKCKIKSGKLEKLDAVKVKQ